MLRNVSGYVCNRGSPSGERDTASPRLWAMLRTQASDEEADDVFSRRSLYYGRAGSDVMGCRRPTDGVFTYVSSDTSHAEGVPHSDPLGTQCLVPHSGNHGYIRNLRRSPSWELRTASPRGRYGERYTHATMLRGVQANFAKKASTKPTLPGQGSCPRDGWWLSVTLSPTARKPELQTLNPYLLGAGTTGPRVELKGLESEWFL